METIHLSFFGGAPGGMEVLLIMSVLLLLFGAKKLPGVARSLGKTLEQFRRAARDVTDEIIREEAKPLPPTSVTSEEEESKEEGDGSGS